MKPRFEVGQVLRQHWDWAKSNGRFNAHQLRNLRALSLCRTAEMGGHVDACNHCGCIRISYNFCRNRHCPKCQAKEREEWILRRQADLLPVPYFHMVFTLPSALNPYCLRHPAELYKLLFQSAWQTLKAFAKDAKHLGAQPGMVAILHTWGQQLMLHPHIHCIVPGGGLTAKGKWKHSRAEGKYLFPKKAVSKVFRAKFAHGFRQWAASQGIALPEALFKQLFAKPWVVYAKRPFLGPNQVLEYLGRYTHKIAISNYRLLSVTPQQVAFSYKDYRQKATQKTMALDAHEFIRRFALHILPPGFVRIRHYGILASRNKSICLQQARAHLKVVTPPVVQASWKQICAQRLGFEPDQCPYCHTGRMVYVIGFGRGGPPWEYLRKRGFNLTHLAN